MVDEKHSKKGRTVKFKNSAKPVPRVGWNGKEDLTRYGFDRPSPYLQLWGNLLQAVISQSATFMLTGKFHTGPGNRWIENCLTTIKTHQYGIYKCEGGCRVEGVGDLVLMNSYCYWDYGHTEKHIDKISSLITDIVLEWNPNEPIQSMLETASKHIGCTFDDLENAIYNSRCGGVLGGNPLSDFFSRSPFDSLEIDENYERFCLINFNEKSNNDVNQIFSDRKLGKILYEKLRKKCKENGRNSYLSPLCCSPRRMNDGSLAFWINTGRSTQMDGWKTEEEINDFLKGDGVLHDNTKW